MNTRRCALAALACVLLLAGCGRQKPALLPPLEELPADYGLDQAREDGERLKRTFSCLKCFEGEAATPGAAYDAYIRYILVDDDTVTWEQLMHGVYSSRFGDYIPFCSVYTDYIYHE